MFLKNKASLISIHMYNFFSLDFVQNSNQIFIVFFFFSFLILMNRSPIIWVNRSLPLWGLQVICKWPFYLFSFNNSRQQWLITFSWSWRKLGKVDVNKEIYLTKYNKSIKISWSERTVSNLYSFKIYLQSIKAISKYCRIR